MEIFKTYEEAEEATSEAVIQVEGGFCAVTWEKANEWIRDEAESLHDRGWKSYDRDAMITAYDFDIRYAESICHELAEIEEENGETEEDDDE